MSKHETNNWINGTENEYLKRYLGIHTNSGLKAFKAQFKVWAQQPDSKAIKADRLTVLKEFQQYTKGV
jgi:hypothetical protein